MRISERGLDFLKQCEGLRLEVYLDAAGLPTIGYGHLLTKPELTSGKIFIVGEPVRYNEGLTEKQASDLFRQEVREYEDCVTLEVLQSLEQHQFDALVSFAYNVGCSAFENSTLLKRVNEARLSEVPAQLRRWVHCGAKVVQGLVNRREKEVRLWSGEWPI